MKLFFLLLLVFSSKLLLAASLIPNQNTHSAFLYNDWQASRANVILFIDPLCPYCKKAIPRLVEIKNYNVYVFWSPIFGDRSEKIITPLFKCENPTSLQVLEAFVNKNEKQLQCELPYNQYLRELNDEMVENYKINSVPSYYVQGVRTSLSRLITERRADVTDVNGVKINWARYHAQKISNGQAVNNMALIISNDSIKYVQNFVNKFRPKYLFVNGYSGKFCEFTLSEGCKDSANLNRSSKQAYLEIISLFGIEDYNDSFLISNSGEFKTL